MKRVKRMKKMKGVKRMKYLRLCVFARFWTVNLCVYVVKKDARFRRWIVIQDTCIIKRKLTT